ncbi:threonine--tRNA ligase [Fuerstiella marisgermanici]|uniref:Threonine--tRNA ligase n=1 Tax=Fuerstiella marisgermanici TaxID=1891926 RepID=A0A1P8WHL0_9PLAN|nr:threonine--tRNA ligase [Fuerstiella marisgermanici]APZ93551.1 Threonine--tRNA ligase [Fuerstiella marisgermanici]
MIQVQLPDGNTVEHDDNATALDVAKGISEGLARATAAAVIDGNTVDAMRPLKELTDLRPVPLQLLTTRDAAAAAVMRHSCAHIMARAIMRLYEGVGLAFGPVKGNTFYYDFDLATTISEDDFPKIEAEMKKIVKEGEAFERFTMNRDESIQFCEDLNQELKVEHIRTGLADHDSLSFYRQGEFVDLCRGPHIPHAGMVKAFKILSVAGSHWKGDVSNRGLQRVYGTAFFDKKELKAYLEQLEEAKKRDHRVLGNRLQLFTINPDVGQGLCLWLPKGATIRATLEDFIKQELTRRGYEPVYSPHIGRVELYETSGHFPYYRDSQFAPLFGHSAGQLVDYWIRCLDSQDEELQPPSAEDEAKLLDAALVLGFSVEDFPKNGSAEEKRAVLRKWEKQQERYLLKPMNCPHHVQMYKAIPRSYRDLPVKLAEFGTVYRHEQSGELNGLLRVRGLTQDDAHLFCTPDQVEQEFKETLGLVKYVLEAVGLEDYRVQLSTRDPNSDKYVGSEELWDNAESVLRKVLTEEGLEFVESPGDAAFYGPKTDFMVKDCLGREWQLGTVQLDYNLPNRFDLEYTGSDNKPHRPVMIHRAPFGSMERFVGVLIEHFAGAFPLWLAPEQIRVLPLSEKSDDYAKDVAARLRQNGFRVTTDLQSAKLQAKIRDAQMDLIPYMLVVGPKEAEQNAVAVRCRIDGDQGVMSFDDALQKLTEERDNQTIRQVVKSTFSAVDDSEEEANEY